MRAKGDGLRIVLLGLPAVLLWLALAGPALGTTAPHVVTELDTDACAMCHRAHTSFSKDTWRTADDTLFSSLLVGSAESDVELCLSCHGIGSLGSGTDVQTSLLEDSKHLMYPDVSAYGPPRKECGSCHDPHGPKDVLGTPYAVLLRSYSPDGDPYYAGEDYCVTCHPARAGQRWYGLAVFEQTAHSKEMTLPASGTEIRCSNCHSPHGSPNAPLIVEAVVPPAADATVTVPANDRRLCFACHLSSLDTYAGKNPYDSSSHALSAAATTIPGAWPSEDATRLVGECQVCHAPMGRDDGSGDAIPEMLETAGRALCDRCHDSDGPASADVSSTAYPDAASTDLEILVSVVPSTPVAYDERLAVYSRETEGAQPRLMVGPREYRPSVGMGEMAAGDIDGDGRNELVLADPAQAKLDVWAFDPLRGLADATGSSSHSIAAAADLVAVADVVLDGSGRPEIVVVDADTSYLRVYRYVAGSLTLVDGPHTVGAGPSSLATGDVTGSSAADVVVTARGDDEFEILTESGGTLISSGPFSTGSSPQGASVGDVWAGGTKAEVAIVNSGASSGSVSVFDGSGSLLGTSSDSVPAGVTPWDSVVADVLPGTTPSGTSGLELSVVFRDDGGSVDSLVRVFPQTSGGGLDTPLQYVVGQNYGSGTLAHGDVDGDGRHELLVGNGGFWSRDSGRTSPSVSVLRANTAGTALETAETLWGGGTELAGEPPSLVVADLGPVGPSRHAVGGAPGSHVSTESLSLPRHVECEDCHDPHESTDATASAPAAYGVIGGTWGVEIDNVSVSIIQYTEKRGIDYEYELCLKCHSGWAELGASRNLAFEFNPFNPSEHAVEETSTDPDATAGSYVSGWGNDSILFCVDCHGMSASSETTGPHSSYDAPILKSPYLGTRMLDAELLCYDCHVYDVYYSGIADGMPASTSRFYDGDLAVGRRKLHGFHSGTRGYGCAACHVSHGTPDERHLIRSEVAFSHTASGGSCANDCHTGGASHGYSRP